MKVCKCGSGRFTAHQVCYHDVVVDGGNEFVSDKGCYESNTPYGPYTCRECGTVYDDLELLDEESIEVTGDGICNG